MQSMTSVWLVGLYVANVCDKLFLKYKDVFHIPLCEVCYRSESIEASDGRLML